MSQVIPAIIQTVEEEITQVAKEEITVLIAKKEGINGIISGKWRDET